MKIAILGYGVEGQAAYNYWNKPENDITICDKSTDVEVPSGAHSQLGPDYLNNLGDFDLLVRSPFLHPRDLESGYLAKVTTNTNEFFKVCPTKNIIGVTGTKGKGTTSTLITKMLEAAGKRVHLGGNIGIAPLDMLKQDIGSSDWVVLELSNFQLIDIKSSPKIGVVLMVEPEHMDWHTDMAEYTNAKQQLFAHQTANDFAIYNGQNENSKHVAEVSPGSLVPYMRAPGAEVIDGKITIGGQTICDVSELKLLGKHNWQNVCAALTAFWQIDQDVNAAHKVLATFSGLDHRLQLVRELEGVKYYDDSFGTTPETAIVAIEAFKEPKVVILGGSDKGANFDELANTVKNNNVREVISIGLTAPKIEEALRKVGFSQITPGGDTMTSIVAAAKNAAQAGDVVLLSTGCASFGLFKNYKDRAEQFIKAVQELS